MKELPLQGGWNVSVIVGKVRLSPMPGSTEGRGPPPPPPLPTHPLSSYCLPPAQAKRAHEKSYWGEARNRTCSGVGRAGWKAENLGSAPAYFPEAPLPCPYPAPRSSQVGSCGHQEHGSPSNTQGRAEAPSLPRSQPQTPTGKGGHCGS